ncbi:MAG TPA: PBP1A family penicillin-binding protein [Pyrinomonadaceae bacterium]|nr:PBP1A family penicillin-binding protein [Pyrinomonadaceae bacterium]
MSIEVTSVPEAKRFLPVFVSARLRRSHLSNTQFAGRLAVVLIIVAAVATGDTLLRSYKYYARMIDARLANGYLTSRPGLYAAPRLIEPKQKLSKAELSEMLRRAGYTDSAPSTVWNGSFRETDSTIEIYPAGAQSAQAITVLFKNDREVEAIVAGAVPLEKFSLEPEVLSNDLSSKTAERDNLSFNDIPPVLVHAILSIEDQRFFEHPGVDAVGILRALARNAGDEKVGQGGSTITQQLIKNTYLSPERTFSRKYAEAMLAYALERRLSKQDIFALYCNELYLGQRGALAARGVRQAAHIYFGKELKDISLGEAAAIAGLIQGPARYSPDKHADALQARQRLVLDAMVRNGYVTTDEADRATAKPLTLVEADHSTAIAPYFVDYVNRISGENETALHDRIYTTLDLDLQRMAERALSQQLDRLNKTRDEKLQGALVALDPKTGNVVAMVGGRDYAESQLNRATDARRQPGSTFKPFVYAAALEDGFSPSQTFSDTPREFIYDRNKSYRPSNFGNSYSMRDVTMRTALVKSLNVVTVDLALQTGLARIANLAADFGLPRPERYPSLALGTGEVTPLELAAAYATFANGGHRVEPRIITSVGEPPGTHLDPPDRDKVVIRDTTAYMITNMLEAVVDHGTARAARGALKGISFAAKTGTSRDGWFVGYTPNLVCVVWIGYDDNRQLGLTGAEAALPAWVNFMQNAIAAKPALGGKNFECPEGIEFVEIDSDSGLIATLSCPHRELIAVTERAAPNVECYEHGNLPHSAADSDSEFTDATAYADRHTEHARNDPRQVPAVSSTHVETDSRGRRTLISALR